MHGSLIKKKKNSYLLYFSVVTWISRPNIIENSNTGLFIWCLAIGIYIYYIYSISIYKWTCVSFKLKDATIRSLSSLHLAVVNSMHIYDSRYTLRQVKRARSLFTLMCLRCEQVRLCTDLAHTAGTLILLKFLKFFILTIFKF